MGLFAIKDGTINQHEEVTSHLIVSMDLLIKIMMMTPAI